MTRASASCRIPPTHSQSPCDQHPPCRWPESVALASHSAYLPCVVCQQIMGGSQRGDKWHGFRPRPLPRPEEGGQEAIPCSMTSNNIEECSNLAVRLRPLGPGGAADNDCQALTSSFSYSFFLPLPSSLRPLLYQDIPSFLSVSILFFFFLSSSSILVLCQMTGISLF